MSATITLARQDGINLIQHINDVDKKQGLSFHCVGCGKEMIVVKSEARKKDWHFRHSEDTLCTGGRDKALHNYAVQILMENKAIRITKSLNIEYSEPRKEVSLFGKRSDVMVTYEKQYVHFEVFVTHDLDQEKIDIYKNNKIKCVRVNLSDPKWLAASPEQIKDEVLSQHGTKTSIYWEDEVLKPDDSNDWNFNLKHILIVIAAFIGVRYLWRLFFSSKRQNLK